MKVTFITFHNWETKRIGGFHKFAEATAKAGHEVVFFSFARPYYTYFKHTERLNKDILIKLIKGIRYEIVGEGGRISSILNCTWPTLRIPMPFYKYLPKNINHWFNTHSLTPFNNFQRTILKGTDIFVFESCEGVILFDLIKHYNPNAKFIYRPSDPLMVDGVSDQIKMLERNILTKSDKVLVVNNEGLNLYRKKILDFDKIVNYQILSNGVDTSKYKIQYSVPALFKGMKNIALYVGARIPEWNLLIETAKECPQFNIVCVCPENAPYSFINSGLNNLFYVDGIPPQDVPAWVTNCDVVIIPNPAGRYKIKPWGITAKYYQAMAASKPIVAFDDTDDLLKYGVFLSHNYNQFIEDLKMAMTHKKNVNYILADKDWNDITVQFLKEISK